MTVNINSGIGAQVGHLATLLCAKASIPGPNSSQTSISKGIWFITQALTIILGL